MNYIVFFVSFVSVLKFSTCARILGIFPIPSVSHQVVFRALSLELAKRGHEVVVITTHPANAKNLTNLKEIDIFDISMPSTLELMNILHSNVPTEDAVTATLANLTKSHLKSPLVLDVLLKEEENAFDLIVVEILAPGTLGYVSKFKAPIIGFSSFTIFDVILREFGVPTHPISYPSIYESEVQRDGIIARTKAVWQYIRNEIRLHNIFKQLEEIWNECLSSNVPNANELLSRVDLLFLNLNEIWMGSRPLPPNVVLTGSLHLQPQKPLTDEFQKLLGEATEGIVYFSLGTNVLSKNLPKDKLSIFVNAFRNLPYKVFWKFEEDKFPMELPPNIQVRKWFPQGDMLGHPNIKAFITQCGQQSIDEAIRGHVPMIGIPYFFDQPMNGARIAHFGIGVRLHHETFTADVLKNAINEVIDNPRYKRNIEKLERLINDQPMSDLDRAVWWSEYLIRNKDAKHFRGVATKVPMYQYLLLDVIAFCLLGVILLILVVRSVYRSVIKTVRDDKNKKMR